MNAEISEGNGKVSSEGVGVGKEGKMVVQAVVGGSSESTRLTDSTTCERRASVGCFRAERLVGETNRKPCGTTVRWREISESPRGERERRRTNLGALDELLGSDEDTVRSSEGQRAPPRLSIPPAHLPMGAPRPLLIQRLTVSKGAQASSRLIPVLAIASHILAPSQCIIMPSECMASEILTISS